MSTKYLIFERSPPNHRCGYQNHGHQNESCGSEWPVVSGPSPIVPEKWSGLIHSSKEVFMGFQPTTIVTSGK